jgi:hypothetical protein
MTFIVKVRTSPGAPMTAEYHCPIHGRFETTVARDCDGNPPPSQCCPVPVRASGHCGMFSPWCISAPGVHTQFVVSASQGRPDPKPHPNAMDTRMLAEGRKNDFRRQRKAIREADRHRRVKELLK